MEEETRKWKQALIVYVVGITPSIIGTKERFIEAEFTAKPKIYYHNEGYFIVRFNSMADRDEGARSLSRISSGLGIPLYADACTTQLDRITYARVLIKMDITRELPKSIRVTDPNGRVFNQSVAYDWMPEFCQSCRQIGHSCGKDEQQMQKTKIKQQKQRQEWMPKERSNDKIDQSIAVKNNQQAKGTTSTKENSNAKIDSEKGELNWTKATGKSIARNKEKMEEDAINTLNGFNILAESGLQLLQLNQLREGSSRQRRQEEVEGGSHGIFIPV
ncbi:PREDICTED: uncharacterized protein LOC109229810 [Nicotiana attenuata]|uniref:uncharacterized protein LOC109229810 n=1 Tax=Nicotiana attenuata TaxID=49451 RepID=UPI00090524FA|nr:PREDICTED: uncharacterized protein LOC109229810 [Nicotiana attenuata]